MERDAFLKWVNTRCVQKTERDTLAEGKKVGHRLEKVPWESTLGLPANRLSIVRHFLSI